MINYTAYASLQAPLPFIAACLALTLLLAACLPSSGQQTRTAATASARVTATRVTPLPSPKAATRTPTPVPASGLEIDPADLDGLQITLWHPWSGAMGKALEALVAEL